MSTILPDLRYSESHEFVRVDGNTAYIGITDFAQGQLGNVVYVELPEEGDTLTAGETFGAVESVKAASDLIAPLSGTVIAINEALNDAPELVNKDAFEQWFVQIELSDPDQLEQLLTPEAYAELTAQ